MVSRVELIAPSLLNAKRNENSKAGFLNNGVIKLPVIEAGSFLRGVSMNKKKVLALSGALSLAILLGGCGEKAAAPSVEKTEAVQVTRRERWTGSAESYFAVIIDDLGREVRLAKKPERIVVTSASFLEPLHAVGGDVVGRPDSRTSMPEFAKNKTSIGRVYNIDVEKLIACAPDLVIVNKGMNEKLLTTLDMNRIPALVLDMKNYESVKRGIEIFAKVTGNVEEGKAYIRQLDEGIEKIVNSVPKEDKRIVILHSTGQGLSVQLDTSIAGSVAKGLGFVNVAQGMSAIEGNPDAAPYSIEMLVEQNPEIMFITSMGKIEDIKRSMEKNIADSPAWQTIPAVKNGKVYYLSQNNFLLSPGVRFPEAFREMGSLIYPEAVK